MLTQPHGPWPLGAQRCTNRDWPGPSSTISESDVTGDKNACIPNNSVPQTSGYANSPHVDRSLQPFDLNQIPKSSSLHVIELTIVSCNVEVHLYESCLPFRSIRKGMSATQAESIRKSFRDYVLRHGGVDDASPMLETTLIRDGSYCGRRFSLSGYSAIWFIDEQQVKLYGQNGTLLQSTSSRTFCLGIPAATEVEETRRAA